MQSVLLTVLAVVLLVTGALIAVSAEQLAQALGLSLCHEISTGFLDRNPMEKADQQIRRQLLVSGQVLPHASWGSCLQPP